MSRIIALFTLILIALPLGCQRQSDQATQEKLAQVNEFFSEWEGARPGGAVAIISDGEIIYERYLGFANLEMDIPFAESSVTDIGSISKQFTAFCIALLEDEGKLHVNDDIRDYIPEMHEHDSVVAIKNLLFHTSGIKDHEELVKFMGQEPYGDHMNNAFAVQLISRQTTLNFNPGTKYEYSNANYVLLTEIVERVSAIPFSTFAKERIFDPLGMRDTFFNLNQGGDFENRAWGYRLMPNGYERPIYKSQIIGDGGLYTTVRDFIKWDANFRSNKLGENQNALAERMKYREPLADGRPNFMAFAQMETMHSFGNTSWSHGGSGGGYRSFYIRFEEPAFSVIVFGNAEENNAFEKANAIVDLFLNDETTAATEPTVGTESPEPEPFATLNLEEAARFLGYYFNKENLQLVGITFNDSEQVFYVDWYDGGSPGYRAIASDSVTLVESEDATQTYTLDVALSSLTHRINDRVTMAFIKLEPFSKSLSDYAGTYYSEELDFEFTLHVQGNTLSSDNSYFTYIIPMSNTVFYDAQSRAVITFSDDDSDTALYLELDIPIGDRSLRKMKFARQS